VVHDEDELASLETTLDTIEGGRHVIGTLKVSGRLSYVMRARLQRVLDGFSDRLGACAVEIDVEWMVEDAALSGLDGALADAASALRGCDDRGSREALAQLMSWADEEVQS
jgi:hypothetical protein